MSDTPRTDKMTKYMTGRSYWVPIEDCEELERELAELEGKWTYELREAARLEAELAELKQKRLRELEEIDNLAKNCLVRDLNDGVAALNQIRNRIKATTKEDV